MVDINWEYDGQFQELVSRDEFYTENIVGMEISETLEKLERFPTSSEEWDLERYCISEESWHTILHSSVNPAQVFVHPRILLTDRNFTRYYKLLSGISGKVFTKNHIHKKPIKRHHQLQKSQNKLLKYTRMINKVLSEWVERNKPITEDKILIKASIHAGTKIEGKWKHRKGYNEEKKIKKAVFDEMKQRSYIQDRFTSLFNSQYSLVDGELMFKTEPDISIEKVQEETRKVPFMVEIKGGSDWMNALERFGQAIKSFEQYPSSYRVLTMRETCKTDEVVKRIKEKEAIDDYFFIKDDYEQVAREIVDELEQREILTERQSDGTLETL